MAPVPRNLFGSPEGKAKEVNKGKDGRKMETKKMKERKRAGEKEKKGKAKHHIIFSSLFGYPFSIS